MIQIYTDASVKGGKAHGAMLILTDSNYMGYDVRYYGDVSPQVAEIRACVDAIEYAQKLCPDFSTDETTLYCDNETVVEIVNSKEYSGRLAYEISKLKDKINEYKITLVYIKGHSVDLNPNVTVDAFLRNNGKGGS